MKVLFGHKAFEKHSPYRITTFPYRGKVGEIPAHSKTARIVTNVIFTYIPLIPFIFFLRFMEIPSVLYDLPMFFRIMTILCVAFLSAVVLTLVHEGLHMVAACLVGLKVQYLLFFPFRFSLKPDSIQASAAVSVVPAPVTKGKYLFHVLLPFFGMTVTSVVAMILLRRVTWLLMLTALFGISGGDWLIVWSLRAMPHGAWFVGGVWFMPDEENTDAQVVQVRCFDNGSFLADGWHFCKGKVTPLAPEEYEESLKKGVAELRRWADAEHAKKHPAP